MYATSPACSVYATSPACRLGVLHALCMLRVLHACYESCMYATSPECMVRVLHACYESCMYAMSYATPKKRLYPIFTYRDHIWLQKTMQVCICGEPLFVLVQSNWNRIGTCPYHTQSMHNSSEGLVDMQDL
jgi:hypothetical protein